MGRGRCLSETELDRSEMETRGERVEASDVI